MGYYYLKHSKIHLKHREIQEVCELLIIIAPTYAHKGPWSKPAGHPYFLIKTGRTSDIKQERRPLKCIVDRLRRVKIVKRIFYRLL